MNITKTIMTIGIASAMTMQFSACKETQHENPLLAESRGNTGDLMQMFTDFTGMQQPDASSLLKARGL